MTAELHLLKVTFYRMFNPGRLEGQMLEDFIEPVSDTIRIYFGVKCYSTQELANQISHMTFLGSLIANDWSIPTKSKILL